MSKYVDCREITSLKRDKENGKIIERNFVQIRQSKSLKGEVFGERMSYSSRKNEEMVLSVFWGMV